MDVRRAFVVAVCLAACLPVGTAHASRGTAADPRQVIDRLQGLTLHYDDVRLPRVDWAAGISEATNNSCGAPAASDQLRVARVQTWYHAANSRFRTSAAISNEVVLYRPGGAAAVLAELRDAPSVCGTLTWAGGSRSYHPGPRLPGLRKGSVVLLTGTRRSNGYVEHGIIVAQRRGDVVSFLYIQDYTGFDISALAKRLSRVLARRLAALPMAATQHNR